jgi:hypothetical protein
MERDWWIGDEHDAPFCRTKGGASFGVPNKNKYRAKTTESEKLRNNKSSLVGRVSPSDGSMAGSTDET